MNIQQVAAQLYTVREYLQTPADIAASLKKIRAIGYQAVQVSGMAPIAEAELLRMLRGEGLMCCATHEDGAQILDAPAAIVDRLQQLDCHITAYPFPAGVNFDSLAALQTFCAQLNRAGEVLHSAGQILCYHNHHMEFRRIAGRSVLEIIYAETNPRFLQGEPDTYWVQYGGGDPVHWCTRLTGRLPILHIKDYAIDAKQRPTFAEIGNGNLNWPAIIDAADRAGCQWYAVEQDICPGDPFASLQQSFNYLRDNLCVA